MNVLFGSLHGSPGVTSLVVILAHSWKRGCLVIEADLSGGVLAARYNLLQGNPGLLSLIAKSRKSIDESGLKESYQYLPSGIPVVVSTGKSSTIEGLVKELPLLDIKEAIPDEDIFVDIGRTDIPSCLLLDVADILVLVVHPYFEQLDFLLSQVAELGSTPTQVGVVLAATPENSKYEYSRVEIDSTLRSVSNNRVFVLAEIVYDRKAAYSCFVGGPQMIQKSLLYRSVKSLAQSLEGIKNTELVEKQILEIKSDQVQGAEIKESVNASD